MMAGHDCPSPRLIRLIDHLHRLGPRSTGAALLELADPVAIERCLERFARLDPEILDVMDGRDFPPHPMMKVPTSTEDGSYIGNPNVGPWRRLGEAVGRHLSKIIGRLKSTDEGEAA